MPHRKEHGRHDEDETDAAESRGVVQLAEIQQDSTEGHGRDRGHMGKVLHEVERTPG